jgi:hypothetical protein
MGGNHMPVLELHIGHEAFITLDKRTTDQFRPNQAIFGVGIILNHFCGE